MEILDKVILYSQEIFEFKLVGVYLHGSMAMGCFNPVKSDIDLIIVINDDLTDTQKLEFMEKLVMLNMQAPPKGIEMSIVKEEYCKCFQHPMPFELHFSPTHLKWFQSNPVDYIAKMKGFDRDLAAHIMIIKHYGKVLYGEAIEKIFSEIPKESYVDSIWYDIESARDDILQNPVYVILNLCRAAAYIKEKLVLSKVKGGDWGLKKLDKKYASLISMALNCYCSKMEIKMEVEWTQAHEFCEYMFAILSEGKENI